MHGFMALMEKVSAEIQERILQGARAGDLKHAWTIAITFFQTNNERDRSQVYSSFFKLRQKHDQSFEAFASKVRSHAATINNYGERDLNITERVKLLTLKTGLLEGAHGNIYEMIITIRGRKGHVF
jgi:hypothetical protein